MIIVLRTWRRNLLNINITGSASYVRGVPRDARPPNASSINTNNYFFSVIYYIFQTVMTYTINLNRWRENFEIPAGPQDINSKQRAGVRKSPESSNFGRNSTPAFRLAQRNIYRCLPTKLSDSILNHSNSIKFYMLPYVQSNHRKDNSREHEILSLRIVSLLPLGGSGPPPTPAGLVWPLRKPARAPALKMPKMSPCRCHIQNTLENWPIKHDFTTL